MAVGAGRVSSLSNVTGYRPFLSHSRQWRVFMVSGKELVAEESVTSYSEVTPSSLKLVLFKKKK